MSQFFKLNFAKRTFMILLIALIKFKNFIIFFIITKFNNKSYWFSLLNQSTVLNNDFLEWHLNLFLFSI